MKNAMARVEKGDFAVHVSQTRSDEIGDLQKGFNHMVEQVDALIAREYDTALRQREAQLSEMMAIINPHFIYNTLEAISMTAYLNDDEEVVEMIGHLGGMFRSMAGNPATGRVPLRQEIRTVESYLTLINVRQDGKILVSWNVDQSLLDGQTLKFTIQPVVENSVIHGFEGRTEGHIWIDIHRDANGDVAIVVQDDGQGMTVDALTRLKHILSHEENPPKNRLLALKNVHDRLRLVFGPHYGVDVRPAQRRRAVHYPADSLHSTIGFRGGTFMISVLIVDDERIIREGLKRLIKTSVRITLLSAKPPTEPRR